MAKTKETIAIEHALNDMCRKKRIYGCEEVTIGFPNDGHGNEIVDFMSMDSKGILRCYEIKISLADLHSNAKLSWYGNYNYLVVSSELYKKVKTWIDEIPNHIGISVYELSWNGMDIVNKRRPIRRVLSPEQQLMVKNGFIRSLTWKMWKYQDAADMEAVQKLRQDVNKWKRRFERERDERNQDWIKQQKIRHNIRLFQKLTGINIEDYVQEHESKGSL